MTCRWHSGVLSSLKDTCDLVNYRINLGEIGMTVSGGDRKSMRISLPYRCSTWTDSPILLTGLWSNVRAEEWQLRVCVLPKGFSLFPSYPTFLNVTRGQLRGQDVHTVCPHFLLFSPLTLR